MASFLKIIQEIKERLKLGQDQEADLEESYEEALNNDINDVDLSAREHGNIQVDGSKDSIYGSLSAQGLANDDKVIPDQEDLQQVRFALPQNASDSQSLDNKNTQDATNSTTTTQDGDVQDKSNTTYITQTRQAPTRAPEEEAGNLDFNNINGTSPSESIQASPASVDGSVASEVGPTGQGIGSSQATQSFSNPDSMDEHGATPGNGETSEPKNSPHPNSNSNNADNSNTSVDIDESENNVSVFDENQSSYTSVSEDDQSGINPTMSDAFENEASNSYSSSFLPDDLSSIVSVNDKILESKSSIFHTSTFTDVQSEATTGASEIENNTSQLASSNDNKSPDNINSEILHQSPISDPNQNEFSLPEDYEDSSDMNLSQDDNTPHIELDPEKNASNSQDSSEGQVDQNSQNNSSQSHIESNPPQNNIHELGELEPRINEEGSNHQVRDNGEVVDNIPDETNDSENIPDQSNQSNQSNHDNGNPGHDNDNNNPHDEVFSDPVAGNENTDPDENQGYPEENAAQSSHNNEETPGPNPGPTDFDHEIYGKDNNGKKLGHDKHNEEHDNNGLKLGQDSHYEENTNDNSSNGKKLGHEKNDVNQDFADSDHDTNSNDFKDLNSEEESFEHSNSRNDDVNKGPKNAEPDQTSSQINDDESLTGDMEGLLTSENDSGLLDGPLGESIGQSNIDNVDGWVNAQGSEGPNNWMNGKNGKPSKNDDFEDNSELNSNEDDAMEPEDLWAS